MRIIDLFVFCQLLRFTFVFHIHVASSVRERVCVLVRVWFFYSGVFNCLSRETKNSMFEPHTLMVVRGPLLSRRGETCRELVCAHILISHGHSIFLGVDEMCGACCCKVVYTRSCIVVVAVERKRMLFVLLDEAARVRAGAVTRRV